MEVSPVIMSFRRAPPGGGVMVELLFWGVAPIMSSPAHEAHQLPPFFYCEFPHVIPTTSPI